MSYLKCFLVMVVCALSTLTMDAQVLVEAESFSHRGGWVVDHQAFGKIGSSCLNAHGAGVPVPDAFTDINVDAPGKYYVYVCTYNWTSPWYKGEGPGAFNVLVNGVTLPEKLGVKGESWGWQLAGRTELTAKTRITLHDLTGFNGRVDAIYFSKEKKTPPSDFEPLRAFRNKALGISSPENIREADLVVAGGGIAGCAAALAAARYGLDVILVDNLPELGGNNWLGVTMSGLMCYNLYPNIGKIVRELNGIPETYHQAYEIERVGNGNGAAVVTLGRDELAALRRRLLGEAGVRVFHNVQIFEAASDGRTVTSITGKDLLTQKEYIFRGRRFVDCTGDGEVGYLLGADYHIGREPRSFADEPTAPEHADQKKLGGTLNWSSREMAEESLFPSPSEIPWAVQCSEEYNVPVKSYAWTWETGFEIDNALEPELVRDNMLRAIFGDWAWLKHNRPEYRDSELCDVAYILQKRESRRIMGEFVLTENDIRDHVEYPDASFTTTWTLDLHYARPDNSRYFPGWEWQSFCHNTEESTWIRPYHVPYRVLYSKDFDNLFIGGRNMSVSHVALGTVRVMATLGMAGEVIGMAAGICDRHNARPADVYYDYLPELVQCMKSGVPGPNK